MRRSDPSDRTPLYRQVADNIRDAIAAGELRPGQLLPPEPRLADEAGVSVDVVRQALTSLRAEGLIVTEHGRGSRVRRVPERVVVTVPPGARITARMPTPAERDELGAERAVPEGVPVLVVERDGDVRLFPADRFVVATVDSGSDP
jgi:DNA-binding transcriptional MocR family regulator